MRANMMNAAIALIGRGCPNAKRGVVVRVHLAATLLMQRAGGNAMKLFIALLLTLPTYAALPSTTVWEVRPTVGSNTNGGGFVTGSSGTDWSQFNAAQYALTNGVTNGTTTVATTSASADMVGNIAYIAGGTGSITAAWYQIVSQTTGVSIVVDRSTGLTAGSGVTINIGG